MLEKAKISECDKYGKPCGNSFYVQFNPNEISIQEPCKKSNQGEALNKDMNEINLQVTLFYNTLTSMTQKNYPDVRGYIRKFYKFTNQDREGKERLEKLCFSWGTLCIVGVLESLNVKYTMFSPEGIPVRCEVSISISGSYYGDSSSTIATNSKEEIAMQTSFMEALRNFQEPQNWKQEAKNKGVVKARSS